MTRGVGFIHALRTCAGSHERIAVIELFGRYCGETSLISAYLAGVERAIIPEVPFDPEKLAKLIMEDKKGNPKNYVMITISEGAKLVGGEMLLSGESDAYGHRRLGGIGEETGELLKNLTGQDVLNQRLSYLMRSGAARFPGPDGRGQLCQYGHRSFSERRFWPARGLERWCVYGYPLGNRQYGQKRVDVRELYDVDVYRPKSGM